MGLNTIEDVFKIEELINLKTEYHDDKSIKGEIIIEGVNKRLGDILGLQTTLIGRIETNPPVFSEIYLREQDASEELKEKYKTDKDKKTIVLPLTDFLKELKLAFKKKIEVELNQKQDELKRISDLLDK